jgi:CheY-like chemotaxis protein
MNQTCKTIDILLVEDNPGDVDLVKEAMSEGKLCNTLHVAGDGLQAMKFLRRQADFSGAPSPDLILLDLNLPKKSGREVLREIKNDPDLQTIPVVILTSSKDKEDICRSYALHANCYVAKPVSLDQFLKVVNSIENFWLNVAKLPGRPRACRREE